MIARANKWIMAPKFKSKHENKRPETPRVSATENMADALDKMATAREKMAARTPSRLCFGVASEIFLLLRISVVLLVCCGQVFCVEEQRFAMEPQDQTAIINSRVTLPCRVVHKSGTLQWTKDDFGLGTHRNLSGYERYSMIGSDEEGDYSLDIRSLSLDDDAVYQCQVSSGPQGQPGIRSRYARLTVLVPPEPPRVVQGGFLATTEDRGVALECVSAGGKPPAEITWVDGKGNVLTGKTLKPEIMADGRRYTARSILHLTPKQHHHNETFTCQAQNTADRTYKAANITLEVKYAPKVTVKVIQGADSENRIPEFSEARIACIADANPRDLTYKWYLNDEPVIGDYTTQMLIFNVTRSYNDAIVKCEVYNSVGKSEESETLDVSYAPSFRARPQSVEAAEGSTETLTCDVDGNPPPRITWRHVEHDLGSVIVGTTPNLRITVSSGSTGRYICRAVVPDYPPIEADAMLYVKGPPKIASPRTQFGSPGDSVRVECTAFSVPAPDKVLWSFGGEEIDALHGQDYAFLEDSLPHGVKSTLIIRESQSRHFGHYNCTATNQFGADSALILLMAQKSFPLLLILFGVSGGIILISAFIMLVILCQRKRRKREQASSVGKKPDVMADINNQAHCKESDRSSNISDLKMELRHADGGCELDYCSQDYSCTGSDAALHSSLGLPLAGAVSVPQDTLYNYTDHYNTTYKDGHSNNAYVPYVDYNRDYVPPSLHVHGLDHPANRLNLSSLSNGHLNLSGSLTNSVETASTVQYGSQNNSLQRILPGKRDGGNQSPAYTPQHNGLKVMGNGVLGGGVDVRYAATYGNPYLRSGSGLGSVSQVNTAKPAATPAPPPYSSIRNSIVGLPTIAPGVSVTSPTSVSSSFSNSTAVSTAALASAASAQPQVARSILTPQSPGSQYILPPTSQAHAAQVVQLTKKGTGNQTSQATHV